MAAQTGELEPVRAVDAAVRTSAEPDAAASESATTSGWPHGRVIDELFRIPVAALIEPDRGTGVFSAADDGRFRLGPAHAGCKTLRVSAPGFDTAHISIDPTIEAPELEVLLRAARTASVIVEFSDGSPARGVQVTWRGAVDEPERASIHDWIDSAAQCQGRHIPTKTDELGRVSVHINTPALAVVQDPRWNVSKSVRIRPGQEERVVLAASALTLHCVDAATQAPRAGLELETWQPRESGGMSDHLRTDSNGDAVFAPTSWPVLVRRPGAAAFQSDLIPLSNDASRCGLGGDYRTMLRIDSFPSDGLVTVGVRACGGRVKLIDADSGLAVHAPVRVSRWSRVECGERIAARVSRCTLRSPRSSFGHPYEIFEPVDGVLELPCFLYAPDDADRGVLPAYELMFVAAGYIPTAVSLSSDRGLPDDALPTVALTPADEKRLRIVHTDGAPFIRPISVYSPTRDVLLWGSDGRADGLHGPLDWLSGDWIVNGSLRVPESDIRSTDVVTLTLPKDTGSILVEGVPADAQLGDWIAKLGVGLAGIVYRPTTADHGSCRFDSLPAGSYMVGPREWVLGAERQSIALEVGQDGKPRAVRTTVREGETAVVTWLASWSSTREIEGQVTLSGSPSVRPFLVAIYGVEATLPRDNQDDVPRVVMGRRSPRIATDISGRYRIARGEPVPALIAICIADEGVWGEIGALHVLDTILPGESIDIPTGSIELRWSGEPYSERVDVSYALPSDSFRHPVRTFHAESDYSWSTAAPARLDGVPTHVRELSLDGQSVTVEIVRGRTTIVEVDSAMLTKSPR
jgi:hypothetical protein